MHLLLIKKPTYAFGFSALLGASFGLLSAVGVVVLEVRVRVESVLVTLGKHVVVIRPLGLVFLDVSGGSIRILKKRLLSNLSPIHFMDLHVVAVAS